MKKYLLFATLSGCAWAVIAYILSLGVFPRGTVIGGLLISPLIGLFIGLVFLPAYQLPKWAQFALSLLTLYLAVSLFGIGVGVADAARDIPMRPGTFEIILQGLIGSVLGITMGYALLLWPLAYLNHQLLARTFDRPKQ